MVANLPQQFHRLQSSTKSLHSSNVSHIELLIFLASVNRNDNNIANRAVYFARNTFGKFFSRTPMIAIVAEQTNAAELESPDPT